MLVVAHTYHKLNIILAVNKVSMWYQETLSLLLITAIIDFLQNNVHLPKTKLEPVLGSCSPCYFSCQ